MSHDVVSTHSRPKAAGKVCVQRSKEQMVSTHSRPKAAGAGKRAHQNRRPGFNTQPPEGGWLHQQQLGRIHLRFNTQPPEGGWAHGGYTFSDSHGFNTQPPEGGWTAHMVQEDTSEMFQHTAARRRLGFQPVKKG